MVLLQILETSTARACFVFAGVGGGESRSGVLRTRTRPIPETSRAFVDRRVCPPVLVDVRTLIRSRRTAEGARALELSCAGPPGSRLQGAEMSDMVPGGCSVRPRAAPCGAYLREATSNGANLFRARLTDEPARGATGQLCSVSTMQIGSTPCSCLFSSM